MAINEFNQDLKKNIISHAAHLVNVFSFFIPEDTKGLWKRHDQMYKDILSIRGKM